MNTLTAKFLLVAVIVSLDVPNRFGQSSTKATLVEGWSGQITCSNIRAKLDKYLSDLANDPQTTGYVVISGKSQRLRELQRRQLIEDHLRYRNFEQSRIRIVKGEIKADSTIELWQVPDGGGPPPFTESTWSYELPNASKPLIVTAEGGSGNECAPSLNVEFFSRFLEANPKFRGNVVVRSSSKSRRIDTARQILNELVHTYGISRRRIRVYYQRASGDEPDSAEYWLLP